MTSSKVSCFLFRATIQAIVGMVLFLSEGFPNGSVGFVWELSIAGEWSNHVKSYLTTSNVDDSVCGEGPFHVMASPLFAKKRRQSLHI